MLEIILKLLFFFIILLGNGLIFNHYLSNKNNFNIYEINIYGLIFTGFLSQFLIFIFPLKFFFLYINFFLIILFLYKIKKKNFKRIFDTKLELIFIILFFLLCIVQVYASGFSDDLNHYHGSYIGNTDNSNLIIGMNFLHNHFGFSSIWLILNSYFNFDGIYLQEIHIFNAIIFFSVISFLIKEIFLFEKKNKVDIYILWLSTALIFLIIKFTRLKEFGIDRGGVLVFIFLISIAVRNVKKIENENIFILSLICLFLTLIKITYVFSFIIPIIFIFRNKNFNFLRSKYFLILCFLFIISISKNVLISGCFIYPFEFTCVKDLSWNSEDHFKNLLLDIEASTKNFNQYNGSFIKEEYIKNFSWFKTWINRNYEELLNIVLTSLLVVLSLNIFIKNDKYQKFKIKIDGTTLIFIFLFLLNLIFFIKAPVIRYHQVLFILFAANVSFIFFNPKKFNLKPFSLLICLCLLFNFTKNINRISKENFKNEPLKYIKKIGWYHKPVERKLSNYKYFIGWIEKHPSTHHELENLKYKKFFIFDIIHK
tara:strand:+ start:9363 stop:10979 length:1617 start_codon:yes stop_codon:yes gene_type:complete